MNKRIILVHLSVAVSESDKRTADEIADAIQAAYEVGSDDDSVRNLRVTAVLAEEI